MKRLSSTILAACVILAVLFAPPAVARQQVVLITVGPGDASWELFGHDMLWIEDTERGINACYNWGLFDFDAPNFIGNFILGRMTYSMDAFEPHSAVGMYWDQQRLVTMQRLDLTPGETDKLLAICEANRQPQNRDYKYDYFKNNCSTRVRDVLDASTGGRFASICTPLAKPSGLSYRAHTLRLMQSEFWLSLGVDFSLGPSCDVPLSAWEECFLPGRLQRFAAPLASSTWAPWTTTRSPEPQTVPNRPPSAAAVGIGLAAIALLLHRWRAWAGRWVIGVWLFVAGAGGFFLLFAWIGTDHAAAYRNCNLLQFSPLAWVVLGLLAIKRWRAALRVAAAILSIATAGLLLKWCGVLSQRNETFIALAMPLNLAAVLVLRRGEPRHKLTPTPPTSEVAAT